jgi:hypothetical protein
VIEQVKAKIVLDDLDADGHTYSVEGFMAALTEERQLCAARAAGAELAAADAGDAGEGPSSDDEGSDDDSDDEEYERVRKLGTLGRGAADVKIVVDMGYGSTKFGVAGEKAPTVLANATEVDGRHDFMIRREKNTALEVDWEQIEHQWFRIFEQELDVDADNCHVSCTVPPYASKDYVEKLVEILYETHYVPGIELVLPAVQSLYATGKITGLVVDSGEAQTCMVPVYDGYLINSAVKTMPFGGRDISECISREVGKAAEFGSSAGWASPGRHCHSPPSLTAIDCHSLGI